MAAEDEAVCVLYYSPPKVVTFLLQFRSYLEEHGFDTSRMGIRDTESSSAYSNDEKE